MQFKSLSMHACIIMLQHVGCSPCSFASLPGSVSLRLESASALRWLPLPTTTTPPQNPHIAA